MKTQEECKTIEKKLNSYNLELLIQCERYGNTDSRLLSKTKQLKTILNDLKIHNDSTTKKTLRVVNNNNTQIT
jgi:hypothetical protein